MTKHTALLAAAALLITSGIASAQTQTPRNYDSSGAPQTSGQSRGGMPGAASGSNGMMTGSPSSTNPQAGGGPNGLQSTPHQVPENGGAPSSVSPQPGQTR